MKLLCVCCGLMRTVIILCSNVLPNDFKTILRPIESVNNAAGRLVQYVEILMRYFLSMSLVATFHLTVH